jgi:hypothetical protein
LFSRNNKVVEPMTDGPSEAEAPAQNVSILLQQLSMGASPAIDTALIDSPDLLGGANDEHYT